MSRITFSKDIGIHEARWDYNEFLGRSNKVLDYFVSICQTSLLDMSFDKNQIMQIGPAAFGWATVFSQEQLQKGLNGGKNHAQAKFLDKLLENNERPPDTVDDNVVVTYLFSNVWVGSDTAASAISSATAQETAWGALKGLFNHAGYINGFARLKYLDAVMWEVMRVTPHVGLMLERIFPRFVSLPDG
ncbi:cytochrome P450 [Penicillium taxi]|uniref:cytochrome P450 n=1 Tax=Penicillium taxi TaxID=168475 RepID=UPI0025458D04|nr:cytochrome P450 [Penicillium taxi]KAJ5887761.1 cytochrome P450 [Penicillium taxi]